MSTTKHSPLPRDSQPYHFGIYLKLALVSIIWGGTFVAGRAIHPDIPPLLSATLRFLLAGATLVLVLILTGRGFIRITKKQVCVLFGLGFCGIYTYNLFFFAGLQHISASRASLIVAANPAMIAIASFLFYKERFSLTRLCGITLCIIGAATVIISKSPQAVLQTQSSGIGDLMIVGCVLSWVAYSVFGKQTVQSIGPLHTVTYSVLAGAVMLTLTTLFSGQLDVGTLASIHVQDFISLSYLGIIGSALAYIWYYSGIEKIGATRAGAFIALNPIAAVSLGALLLGERLSMLMGVGGLLAIVGILLCNRPEKSTSDKPTPDALLVAQGSK
ncbi:putative amino-acid metabolite efflux pump [Vibrio ruber DSM 16370]|uniref:Putative amino-acid metabolite efflux pump n=1 Tax=Vibrio ruber (strain DSM 16370 / JCM 11486 / BCRC 17186 / CECT 7878 / LMG 23124 / VR1) TaxID=1123498 RepID=A0A1R4LHZ3_VIBR1|nr:DMT family transporter [Vibrio ruber]SJN56201.1 putative amino-acid metabolite efflux pump [Vibrio ruber DSM 16370]